MMKFQNEGKLTFHLDRANNNSDLLIYESLLILRDVRHLTLRNLLFP